MYKITHTNPKVFAEEKFDRTQTYQEIISVIKGEWNELTAFNIHNASERPHTFGKDEGFFRCGGSQSVWPGGPGNLWV